MKVQKLYLSNKSNSFEVLNKAMTSVRNIKDNVSKIHYKEGVLFCDYIEFLNKDKVIKKIDFKKFGKNGLPLKYSNQDFQNDVWELIKKEIPQGQEKDFLARFNLSSGERNVLDGIPVIEGFEPRNQVEIQMLELINKFYNNEILLDNSEQKIIMQRILKQHPEFAMVIGKQQHKTHDYSVDIHSLEILQKAINHPFYKDLTDDGKDVLYHTAIMHDYGKKGYLITSGHAEQSKEYAKLVLDTFKNMSEKTKERIINQIENHHWFENYNLGYMSPEGFSRIFKTDEDRKIAIILAKGDFESVNPYFHYKKLNIGEVLEPKEYELIFENRMTDLLNSI